MSSFSKPPSNTPFKTDLPPRRVGEVPGAAPRPAGMTPAAAPAAGPAPAPARPAPAPATEMRKLIVGRDISLSGEITSCDVLVVEGTVEAKLRDGRNIEIAQSGLFKGSVEIDDADIGGRFEGDLTVRGRLRVRATGRIHGAIRYSELEVEAGGQIVGDVQVIVAASEKPVAIAAPSPAPSHEPAIAPSMS